METPVVIVRHGTYVPSRVLTVTSVRRMELVITGKYGRERIGGLRWLSAAEYTSSISELAISDPMPMAKYEYHIGDWI